MGHVAEPKRWMQLHLSGAKLPTDVRPDFEGQIGHLPRRGVR